MAVLFDAANCGCEKDRVRFRRLAKALVFVVALFAALFIADYADARSDEASPSVFDAWGQWNEARRLLDGEVPEDFEREVVSLRDKQEVRIDRSACTVGFSYRGDSEDALDVVRRGLLDPNWVEVLSGFEGCATFVKEDGAYRWLFVQCVSVQEWTSVVIAYAG